MIALLEAILGTYRIGRMLAKEDGPFDLFTNVRTLLGGNEQKTWIGRGVNCPLCISWWVAGCMALFLLPNRTLRARVRAWGAIAGGAVVLYRFLDGFG